MVIDDCEQFALVQVVDGLGNVSVVNQNDLLVSSISDDLRGVQAELLNDEDRLRSEFALNDSLGFHAAFGEKISGTDRSSDGIGIGVFVSNNQNSHIKILLN